MKKHILSKSTFIRGLQCYKSLYLYKNYYHLKDPVSKKLQAVFNRGNAVGELAHKLFPGGIDASPSKRFKYAESVEKTKRLITEGQQVIYEATFQANQVLVMLDILVRQNNKWYAYEVKSSTKISDTYITDAAIQYYVITSSGLKLEDISIVCINNKYVRKGAIDIHKFFKTTSVKDKILEIQPRLSEQVEGMKSVLLEGKTPEKDIGKHCFLPYTCDFMGYCWKRKKDAEIFTLSGMSKEDQVGFWEKEKRCFSDFSINENLTKSQKIQVAGKAIMKKKNIHFFLTQLHYPIWFLDFEVVQYAIPKYEGAKPYQQIPFQFSVHKLDIKGEISHQEFLVEPGIDPRKFFTEALFSKVGKTGSVVAYNATFEKMIIGNLQKWFPEYKQEGQQMANRIVDLMLPFQQKDFYLPAMNGSHSIKVVLPALFPEISYDNLSIKNGYVAAMEYNNLQTSSDMFYREEVKNNLLEYCKMDTYAMVKIYQKLQEIVTG